MQYWRAMLIYISICLYKFYYTEPIKTQKYKYMINLGYMKNTKICTYPICETKTKFVNLFR